ncbi:MAG: hypothetical protein E6Q36_02875 [Chryseobacterium sp.]|nr:MAG: hypothetical protein E6Q36_02875 [Chryseobacterium sp.]
MRNFDRHLFSRLSEDKQIKIEHIYHIASILASHGQPQLTAEEFDDLYDKPVQDLEHITGYIRSMCHNAVYPDIEGE